MEECESSSLAWPKSKVYARFSIAVVAVSAYTRRKRLVYLTMARPHLLQCWVYMLSIRNMREYGQSSSL